MTIAPRCTLQYRTTRLASGARLVHLLPDASAEDQRKHEQREEYEEDDLGDPSRFRGYAGEPEDAGDQCEDEECSDPA